MTVRLIPYLVMNGNAREAIQFYESALGATVVFQQKFTDMPQHPDYSLPEEAKERIAHASLKVGDSELMFSDTFPGQPHHSGNQVTICISSDSKEQSQKLYEALREGGQVHMPLQETHFSPAYAIVTDKFGVTFQINTEGKQ
ncbi:VOC family protein [Brevibacillus fulvus]|uniref:PhnB protein n=1 Tax=Brevibacillus fulvus TaxID=1125967 RepID=A0A939BU58_9BACL|nr:VOC family protein [Brevibacillus fulvus]MBM7592203.1 PhnB protein [Brevibacillus fulvus]